MFLREFQQTGNVLFNQGCNNSHSGNISIRLGNRIIITRSGSLLGQLKSEDLINLSLFDIELNQASRETPVHREIYKINDQYKAITHAHCPYAVCIAEFEDSLIPFDAEGLHFLPVVPVISVEKPIGSQETGVMIAKLMQNYSVVMIKGHGLFAGGKSLDECLQKISSVEHSSKMSVYKKILEKYYRLP